MSDYQCTAVSNDNKTPNITVGDLFKVKCQGTPLSLGPASLLQKNEAANTDNATSNATNTATKADKYLLKIIESTETKDGFELIVTSYRAGNFQNQSLELVTPEGKHTLNGISFKVESLLAKEQPPRENPYGPFGPFSLEFPMHLVWYSLVVLVLFGIIFSLWFSKRRARRRLIEKLSNHDSALNPYMQFHSNLRMLSRKTLLNGLSPQFQIEELYDHFKLYITRQFYIPAFDWKPQAVLTDFRRRNRELAKNTFSDFQILFREYEKMLSTKEKLTDSDFEQILHMTRTWIERVDHLEKRGTPIGRNRL